MSNSCLLYTSIEHINVNFAAHHDIIAVDQRIDDCLGHGAVSYTHLDVYKRQAMLRRPLRLPRAGTTLTDFCSM